MGNLVERLGDMERRLLRVAENMRGDPEGTYNDAATLDEAAAVIQYKKERVAREETAG